MIVLKIVLLLLSFVIITVVVGLCLFFFIVIPLGILASPWIERLMDKYLDWEYTWQGYWDRKRHNE